MIGDNRSVVINTTLPSSSLKKKHLACAHHHVREAIAAKIIIFGHLNSGDNVADICTKPLASLQFYQLANQYLFWEAQTLLQATAWLKGSNKAESIMGLSYSGDLSQECDSALWDWLWQLSISILGDRYMSIKCSGSLWQLAYITMDHWCAWVKTVILFRSKRSQLPWISWQFAQTCLPTEYLCK